MLTLFLLGWSVLTGFMGLATGLGVLLLFRLGCGLFESGAYPACAGVVLGGRPVRVDAVDLRWVGALLYKNAVIEETGLAAAVLNHPATVSGCQVAVPLTAQ